MKMNKVSWMVSLVALGMVATVRAADPASASTEVHNFSYTTGLVAAPLGTLPSVNLQWDIPQYQGPAGDLVGVKLEMKTELFYQGTLVSLIDNKAYNLQVRSDFKFDFGAAAPVHDELDPVVLLSGTSGPALTPFDVPASPPATQSQSAPELLVSGLGAYLGNSTVPVFVTGNLKTDAVDQYHNNTYEGPQSPAVFVDTLKVLPVFGAQLYELKTSLQVTYFVPEAGTYGAGAVIVFGALALGWRRARR